MRPAPAGLTLTTLLLVVAVLLGSVAAAPASVSGPEPCEPGCVLWSARYDATGGSEQVKAVAVDPTGQRVFVTGWVTIGTTFQWGTVAYDVATGARLWAVHAPPLPDDVNVPEALAVSPDGSRVYVTGRAGGGPGLNDADIGVRAYDAETGAELWLAVYDGEAQGQDSPRAIAVSADGARVYVAGDSLGVAEVSATGTSTDFVTVAFDADTGEQAWSARYDGAGMADLVVGLAVSPDSARVYVAGSSPPVPGVNLHDYVTLAYHAATGGPLWEARYHGPGQSIDTVAGMALTPDGGTVVVTGTSDAGARAVAATVAYDAMTGAQRWVARRDDPWLRASTASAVALDGDRVLVLGRSATLADARVRTSPGPQAGWDSALTVTGYDLDDGDERWSTTRRAGDGDTTTRLAAGGGAAVGTGYTTAADGTLDPVTVALHGVTGEALWLDAAADPLDSSWAGDVALSPDATVAYVAGTTGPVTNRDFSLVAYRVGAVPAGPHLVDASGDAVGAEAPVGVDARPVSRDGADLLWGRFETARAVPAAGEPGGQVAAGVLVRLATLGVPAADGATLAFEVHGVIDGCDWSLSTSRRGPLATPDDPADGAVRWRQGDGCPGGASETSSPAWTASVDALRRQVVIAIPFHSLTGEQATLLRVGARVEQPYAVVAVDGAAVDATPVGVTAVIGAD